VNFLTSGMFSESHMKSLVLATELRWYLITLTPSGEFDKKLNAVNK